MIITQTPVRISFFGGGTDYPEHFLRHGGATLVATIDQHTLVTVHRLTRFVEHEIRVHYSQVEIASSLDEVRHPSARECLRFSGIERGVEIHYVSDLPARTGLGSSSSATVGLLHALHALKGERVSTLRLAEEAVHVEQEMIRERVGSQDQYACAVGGLQCLRFEIDGRVCVSPVHLDPARLHALNDRLMLLYTGLQRNAHEVLDEQVTRTAAGDNRADLLRMACLVDDGIDVITGRRDLTEFGRLLHESWTLKQRLSTRITTPALDDFYRRARAAGAVGGKLLGAGGGGFLLLFVEPEHRAQVRRAVPELMEVAFRFESAGSALILNRPLEEHHTPGLSSRASAV
jgi:D-glycero-alpha-D-manno-heptose-7-phosphate kinase